MYVLDDVKERTARLDARLQSSRLGQRVPQDLDSTAFYDTDDIETRANAQEGGGEGPLDLDGITSSLSPTLGN